MPKHMRSHDASAHIADLLKDLQTGQIRYRTDLRGGMRQHTPTVDVTAPVFDFGDMFDVDSLLVKGFSGGQSLAQAYQDDAKRQVLSGDFHLPFPKCFFVYTCAATTANPTNTVGSRIGDIVYANIVYAEQEDTTRDIHMLSFVKVVGRAPNWILTPFQWSVSQQFDLGVVETAFHGPVAFDPDSLEYLTIDMRADNTCVMVGTSLMQQPSAVKAIKLEHGPKASAVNARRAKQKQPPISPVTVIKLLDSVPYPQQTTSKKVEQNKQRKAMPPHDRRGTYRHYKSGKVTWVDALPVKGGSKAAGMQKTYQVTI